MAKICSKVFLCLVGAAIFVWTLLFFAGFRIAIVESASMLPAISVGSAIVFRTGGDFCAGDVVVFGKNGRLVAHRVVSDEGEVVRVKGDNTNEIEAISRTQILGKSVWCSVGVGSVITILKIGVPIVGIVAILWCLHKKKKYLKNR